jgi:hypothetical protein
MQGYRHHYIDAVFVPKKPESHQEKFTEGSCQLNFAFVFETMNNLGKYLLVDQRRTGDAKVFRRCAALTAMMI